jgi:hypothetical protein
MDKFDRYYKSKNLGINEKLINIYVKYDDKTLLISNGYSVIYTKTIPNNFRENVNYSYSIKRYYDNFRDDKNKIMLTLDLEKIKSGLDIDKHYRFSRNYGLDYTQLKKITDIIGCKEINVLSRDNFDSCFIEIKGKNNQVGYLLPARIY